MCLLSRARDSCGLVIGWGVKMAVPCGELSDLTAPRGANWGMGEEKCGVRFCLVEWTYRINNYGCLITVKPFKNITLPV